MRERRAAREAVNYRGADLRYTLPSGVQLKIANRAEWCAFTDIFVGGLYDEAIRQALESASSTCPLFLLDLGANVGFFALRFLDLALLHPWHAQSPITLCMVEPSPTVMLELKARMTQPATANVTLQFVMGLVGQRRGSALLYESSFHIGNSLIPDRYKKEHLVSFVDLDELTQSAEVVSLLKCNIEGAELAFLETYPALLEKVNVGAMELHVQDCDTVRCRELLSQSGFALNFSRQTPYFQDVWFRRGQEPRAES